MPVGGIFFVWQKLVAKVAAVEKIGYLKASNGII